MIVLGTDHAGYHHKEALKELLEAEGYEVKDMGCQNDESCDYPDFIRSAAAEVAKEPAHRRGVIFGGSGQGEAMVANRVKGIRAAVYYGGTDEIIQLSRTHNNANILSIAARFVDEEEMKRVVMLWLNTEFPGEERHVRRIEKIDM
jgi:ribose 5-phosphate isomerase B